MSRIPEILRNTPNLTNGDQERAKRNDRKLGKAVKGVAALALISGGAAAVQSVRAQPEDDRPQPDKAVVCIDSANTHDFTFTGGKGTDDAIASIGSHVFKGNFMNNPCYTENVAEVAEQLGVEPGELEDIIVPQGTTIHLVNYSDPK